MRYHIDTIPVWDAMKIGGECPICALRRKTELLAVDRFLGASVMEPDARIRVNEKGFCTNHYRMLFVQPNRLGLALMLHSHIRELERKANGALKKAAETSEKTAALPALKRMTVAKQSASAVTAAADEILAETGSCVMCESIDNNMNDFLHTFFHLYKTDTAFVKAFEASKGVCLPDAAVLLKIAADELDAAELARFTGTLASLMKENLKRVEDEVEWFTLKFDYRNQSKPWNNSKDAVERTVNKLSSWCVGDEPNPKEE